MTTRFRTTHWVPFTPRQMFDLVADVERYPEFLPLCEGLVVRSREPQGEGAMLLADMTVGYGAIRETFTSRVLLDLPGLTITAGNVPGRGSGPFEQLENRWTFAPGKNGGCDLSFSISYAFRSRMLQMLVGSLFDRAFRRYVGAFEQRAHAIYGSAGRHAGA